LSQISQLPVPIPPRLLAHIRRSVSQGIVQNFIVEWIGAPVKSVKTAFKRAVELAGIEGKVSPHVLRHTAACWLLQAGVDTWEAAGFLGMSVEMLDRVYGHHHPDHLKSAARLIGYRRQSLAISLAEPRHRWQSHVRVVSQRLKPLILLVGPAGLEPATRPL
jgi:integrase